MLSRLRAITHLRISKVAGEISVVRRLSLFGVEVGNMGERDTHGNHFGGPGAAWIIKGAGTVALVEQIHGFFQVFVPGILLPGKQGGGVLAGGQQVAEDHGNFLRILAGGETVPQVVQMLEKHRGMLSFKEGGFLFPAGAVFQACADLEASGVVTEVAQAHRRFLGEPVQHIESIAGIAQFGR